MNINPILKFNDQIQINKKWHTIKGYINGIDKEGLPQLKYKTIYTYTDYKKGKIEKTSYYSIEEIDKNIKEYKIKKV
jgi:hypothetical protein